MKSRKKEEIGLTAARKWVTIRVTLKEKNRLLEQAHVAGLSVSEYMRRRFFGGRPLIAYVDTTMVNELRRLGGLLKHNFETLRQADAPTDCLRKQEEALRMLVAAIERISAPRHDR